MTVRRVNWLKRLVLPTGLAAIDACWVYPWGLFLGLTIRPDNGEPLLSFTAVLALLFVSQVITRWVLTSNWSLPRARLVLVALGLVAVVVAVRLDHFGQVGLTDGTWIATLVSAFPSALTYPSVPVWGLVLAVLLWWRGITHGRDTIKFDDIETAFKLGIVLMVLFMLVGSSAETGSFLQAQAAACVIGFFLASLISLSLARLEDIRGQSQGGEKMLAFNRQWLVVVLGLVATMLVLALGLGQALSFDLIGTVAGPLLRLLESIATVLIYVIAVPLGFIIEGLIFLIRLVLHPGAALPPQIPDMSMFEQSQGTGGLRQLAPEVVVAIKWVLTGLVGVVVLVLMVRSVFRWRKSQQDEEVVEERDSVWTWGSLRSALLAWLRSLGRRVPTDNAPGPMVAALTPQPVTDQSSLVLSIRQIYRHLLRLGASLGLPRALSTTAYEYLPQLQANLGPVEDVAAITNAYVQARYSADAPLDAEVEDVRTRWERVRACAEAANQQSVERADGGESR
ncbi:MAG: DUF4129 domain-containing protein [Chloroflexota bacterium]